MLNNIIVVFSSHRSPEENETFTQRVKKSIGTSVEVFAYPNFNQYSLSEIYNKAMKEHNNKNSIMVFCHNDIHFYTKDWGKRLLAKFNNTNYSIIGVAGTTYLPEKGMWWEKPELMIGIVNHTNGLRIWESRYSEEFVGVRPVVLIDGCFMAVNCNNIEDQFDEDFKGFHFYDLAFCVPNYLDGCNIGVVTDIRILHESVGMINEQWDQNRQQFVEKYKNDLPLIYEA